MVSYTVIVDKGVLLFIGIFLFLFFVEGVFAVTLGDGDVIDFNGESWDYFRADHYSWFTVTQESSGGWDDSRWIKSAIATTNEEDDIGTDSILIAEQRTTVFIGWMMKWGPDWHDHVDWQDWKLGLVFDNLASSESKIGDWHCTSDLARVLMICDSAGGTCYDENHLHQNQDHCPSDGYDFDFIIDGDTGSDQWYYFVWEINIDGTDMLYIWSQDGTLSGDNTYAYITNAMSGSYINYFRLMAYWEGGTPSPDAWMGIDHIGVYYSKPSPPDGFFSTGPACSDGSDNDGDGQTDYPDDPGCSSSTDNSEYGSAECDDGSDNDGDGQTDYRTSGGDSGCSNLTDDDETDCGDWVCEGGETQSTCPSDCGIATNNCVSDLDGVCCTFGQTCSEGSFQTSDDCGSLCCVGGGICQDPSGGDIFFFEGFESGDPPSTFNSDFYGNFANADQLTVQSSVIANGSYAARHHYIGGLSDADYGTQHFGDSTKNPVYPTGQGDSYQDIYIYFKVYYSPGFGWSAGNNKQFIIGTDDGVRHDIVCCNPWVSHYLTLKTGSDGAFAAERNNKASTGQWANLNPNINGYNDTNKYSIETGRWYTLEVRRGLNDEGQSNGIFEMWVDGEKIAEYDNVLYRLPWDGTYGADFSYGTNFIMVSNYINDPSPQDQDVYYDDIKMSTSYIGVEPPPSYECSDSLDNDGDGQTDYPSDTGCSSLTDNDETDCGDGVCEGGENQSSCSDDCGLSIEVIIDNLDLEFTIVSGSGNGWWQSSYPNPYGGDSLGSNVNEGASAAWTPNLPQAGQYEVYAWWTAGELRAGDATYTISHASGTEQVQVNQSEDGGQWNPLGTYGFDAGTSGSVTLTDSSADPGADAVCADAVRFVYAGQQQHRADNNPQDGCIEQHEMMWFIDQWKYDSTEYPMWEMMGAVKMWKSGSGCS